MTVSEILVIVDRSTSNDKILIGTELPVSAHHIHATLSKNVKHSTRCSDIANQSALGHVVSLSIASLAIDCGCALRES